MKTTTELWVAVLALTKWWSVTPTRAGVYILTPPEPVETISQSEMDYWDKIKDEFTNQTLN